MIRKYIKSDKTKKAILKASETLFANQGFEKTTVRQIAKTAEVNVAVIFYHFKTKENLHQEIFENCFNKLNRNIKAALVLRRGADEKIKDIIAAFVTSLRQHKNIHQIILRETINRSKHLELIINKYIQKNHNMIEDTIKEGIEMGMFKDYDSLLYTFNLVGMVLFYFTYQPIIETIDKERHTMDHVVENIYNVFMDGIRK